MDTATRAAFYNLTSWSIKRGWGGDRGGGGRRGEGGGRRGGRCIPEEIMLNDTDTPYPESTHSLEMFEQPVRLNHQQRRQQPDQWNWLNQDDQGPTPSTVFPPENLFPSNWRPDNYQRRRRSSPGHEPSWVNQVFGNPGLPHDNLPRGAGVPRDLLNEWLQAQPNDVSSVESSLGGLDSGSPRDTSVERSGQSGILFVNGSRPTRLISYHRDSITPPDIDVHRPSFSNSHPNNSNDRSSFEDDMRPINVRNWMRDYHTAPDFYPIEPVVESTQTRTTYVPNHYPSTSNAFSHPSPSPLVEHFPVFHHSYAWNGNKRKQSQVDTFVWPVPPPLPPRIPTRICPNYARHPYVHQPTSDDFTEYPRLPYARRESVHQGQCDKFSHSVHRLCSGSKCVAFYVIIALAMLAMTMVGLVYINLGKDHVSPVLAPSAYLLSKMKMKGLTFTDELNNPNSDDYRILEKDFCDRVSQTMSSSPLASIFKTCEVTHFSNGSVDTGFRMKMEKQGNVESLAESATNVINEEIKSGKAWSGLDCDPVVVLSEESASSSTTTTTTTTSKPTTSETKPTTTTTKWTGKPTTSASTSATPSSTSTTTTTSRPTTTTTTTPPPTTTTTTTTTSPTTTTTTTTSPPTTSTTTPPPTTTTSTTTSPPTTTTSTTTPPPTTTTTTTTPPPTTTTSTTTSPPTTTTTTTTPPPTTTTTTTTPPPTTTTTTTTSLPTTTTSTTTSPPTTTTTTTTPPPTTTTTTTTTPPPTTTTSTTTSPPTTTSTTTTSPTTTSSTTTSPPTTTTTKPPTTTTSTTTTTTEPTTTSTTQSSTTTKEACREGDTRPFDYPSYMCRKRYQECKNGAWETSTCVDKERYDHKERGCLPRKEVDVCQ